MTYRVVVDKPRRIRALASRANITVADVNLQKSQVLVARASYAATASARIINAFASYSTPTPEIYYQNLNAIDMVLDPYSLNKYFRGEAFGMTDVVSVRAEKAVLETIGASDQLQNLVIGKGVADELSIGDFAFILLELLRSFADSVSISDTSALGFNTGKTDSLSLADSDIKIVGKGVTDSFTTTDIDSRLLGKGLAETVGFVDSLTRTTTFARSFTDFFTLDDFTDVNAIRKASVAAKSNVVSFSDTQTFGTEKNIQEAATVTETTALLTQRPALDSFSTTDVFQKVTVYSRAFTEATTLSDSSFVTSEKSLSDSTTVSENFQKDVVFSRTFTDALNFSEQSVAAFVKGLSDSTSVTEAIQITTASTASSVLNAGALNSALFNN